MSSAPPPATDVDPRNDLHRRAASIAVVRSDAHYRNGRGAQPSRRLSLSLWRGNDAKNVHSGEDARRRELVGDRPVIDEAEKKGVWAWKPMRALAHIGMRRLACLVSVDVVSVHGLPESINGLRLAVLVRKAESSTGAVQTVPSRVAAGGADFDETLFLRCNLYCSTRGAGGAAKPLRLEARRFLVSVVAVDAPEIEFGKKQSFDLSALVVESVEQSAEGHRVRRWERRFSLAGQAAGGVLTLRLGFQLMEDGAFEIYRRPPSTNPSGDEDQGASPTPAAVRIHSKTSFSITVPKVASDDDDGFDDDLPEFQVIDRGVEMRKDAGGSSGSLKTASALMDSTEAFSALRRGRGDVMMELDAIAKEIQALDSLMSTDLPRPTALHQLDSDEESVTREFVGMLDRKTKSGQHTPTRLASPGSNTVLLPGLGKSLGFVIQTRDGGFLASMNPFDAVAGQDESPKLTMQISKPFVLAAPNLASAFEVFQRLAGVIGDDGEVSAGMYSWAAMDDLAGKSAEQIAFEGIAAAVISGRSMGGGGASSSAATRSIQTVRKMASAMTAGRKARLSTGVWFAGRDDPVAVEDILAFSLQRMEAMAVDALKVQADMADDEAPFEVSPVINGNTRANMLGSIIPAEEWGNRDGAAADDKITVLVAIQLRDLSRRLEAVGAPMIAIAQAKRWKTGDQGGMKYKVSSLHVGGLRSSKSGYDGEKQQLTATQWLVAHGLGKVPWKKWGSPTSRLEGRRSVIWSVSARIVAGVWEQTMRNPDVNVGGYEFD